MEEFFGFQASLSRLLECPVDLIEAHAIRNPYVLAGSTVRARSSMEHDSRAGALVEHPRVWRIVQESLPALRATAAKLLDEVGPS